MESMELKLFNNHVLKSSNEEEFLNFGGPWRTNFSLDSIQLPGEYLLEDCIQIHEGYCALIQIETLGNWRKDIRFSIVVIDLIGKRLIKSKLNFSALSILNISQEAVLVTEEFNVEEAESSLIIEINDSNFIQVSNLLALN